jgi:hypothetical protein
VVRTNKIIRGKWTIEALEEIVDVMENGFISLQNANQTWNIPLTSLSNHLVCKTRFTEHGQLGVLTHDEDLTIVGWIFNMQNFGMLITL